MTTNTLIAVLFMATISLAVVSIILLNKYREEKNRRLDIQVELDRLSQRRDGALALQAANEQLTKELRAARIATRARDEVLWLAVRKLGGEFIFDRQTIPIQWKLIHHPDPEMAPGIGYLHATTSKV